MRSKLMHNNQYTTINICPHFIANETVTLARDDQHLRYGDFLYKKLVVTVVLVPDKTSIKSLNAKLFLNYDEQATQFNAWAHT
jgi:hypothetical protein